MLIFLSMLESDEERRLFTDLYNQYGNMMLHVAKRYFPKDMYAAEDVVQNAWIRVVDHFQKIQAVPSKKRGAKVFKDNAAMPDTHIAKQRIIIGKLGFFNIMTS